MTSYLLDTHTLIWFFTESEEMPSHLFKLIEDPINDIYVASISLFEMTIKISKNKLDLGIDIDDLYNKLIRNRFSIIPIDLPYLLGYKQLPLIHKDPYDRLLIATAKAENLTLITRDVNIHKYDVNCVW